MCIHHLVWLNQMYKKSIIMRSYSISDMMREFSI